MDTSTQSLRELSLKNACVQFMFAYQQRDIGKMMGLCDLSGEVNFTPLGENGKGRIGELGKALWTALIESFPDIDNTLDAAVAAGDNTVKCQVVIRGTQAKDFAGIASKGLRFESDHIFIFHLNPGGKIDQISISWNHEDLVRQLSASH